MAGMLRPRFPYRARRDDGANLWGVWDNRHGRWAERPTHPQRIALRLTRAMVHAYAAGAAAAIIEKVR
jgi:hypothetical protein